MTTDEKFCKHLELIQSAISRLSSNSFAMKKWCFSIITIITSVFAFIYENSKNEILSLIFFLGMILLTIAFWYIDSLYLLSERKLRKLYEDSVKKNNQNEKINLFSMDTKHLENKRGYYSIVGTMFSKTEFPLYFVLLLLEIAIMIFFNHKYILDFLII